jgi:hypothetical protein
MIIYFGTRLYGKTHVVPGTCHVATRFLHIYRVPLIPLGSWIVTSQTGSTWQGIKTSVSIKSVLLAWVRAALAMLSLVGCLAVLVEMCQKGAGARLDVVAAYGATAFASFLLWRGSYRFSTAGPEKARELLVKLGMPDEVAADFAFVNQTPAVGTRD